MNKDQVKGRVEEAKGKLKEVVGKATGNQTTKLKGKVEQLVGKPSSFAHVRSPSCRKVRLQSPGAPGART